MPVAAAADDEHLVCQFAKLQIVTIVAYILSM